MCLGLLYCNSNYLNLMAVTIVTNNRFGRCSRHAGVTTRCGLCCEMATKARLGHELTRKPCCRKETARCRSCFFRFFTAMLLHFLSISYKKSTTSIFRPPPPSVCSIYGYIHVVRKMAAVLVEDNPMAEGIINHFFDRLITASKPRPHSIT